VSFKTVKVITQTLGSRDETADGSVNYINATSSELLHLIVTRGPVADPDIISHFREDEVRDTNGNGLPEFVDGWNKPIAFRRWPIGFNSPMQPIDGTLRNIEPLISSNGHRLVPLIFSAGLDGSYDIEAMTSLSYGALNYNPFPSSPGASAIAIAPQSPAVAGSVVVMAAAPPTTASPPSQRGRQHLTRSSRRRLRHSSDARSTMPRRSPPGGSRAGLATPRSTR
jgi:hypothetical protein